MIVILNIHVQLYIIYYFELFSLQGLTPLFHTVLHGGDPYCSEILLNDQAELHNADHQGMQEIHLVSFALLMYSQLSLKGHLYKTNTWVWSLRHRFSVLLL